MDRLLNSHELWLLLFGRLVVLIVTKLRYEINPMLLVIPREPDECTLDSTFLVVIPNDICTYHHMKLSSCACGAFWYFSQFYRHRSCSVAKI